MGRLVLLTACICLALAAGVAFGQALDGEQQSNVRVEAAECPEATKAFEAAAITPPAGYAFTCPNADRVNEVIEAVLVDQQLREQMKAGQRPLAAGEGVAE